MHLCCLPAGPVEFTLAFDGDGEGASSMKGTAAKGVVKLQAVPVPNPTLWSTKTPTLHNLTVTYNGGVVVERFGLRSWGVDTETARLTVNGNVQKLVGWNHHTQWPVTAASPTDAQIAADIKLLLAAGATYVRGAHYPHDPRVLDAYDEAGIAFWSETLGPGVSLENTKDPRFMKYQLEQVSMSMLLAHHSCAVARSLVGACAGSFGRSQPFSSPVCRCAPKADMQPRPSLVPACARAGRSIGLSLSVCPSVRPSVRHVLFGTVCSAVGFIIISWTR
eukprot:SAG11_NODE_985_length_6288_cov_53.468972_3_plen_277_part_00